MNETMNGHLNAGLNGMKTRAKSAAYNRHQAALRQARKRARDAAVRAPSMPEITLALGYAARAVLASERLAGRLLDERGGIVRGPAYDLVSHAMNRLRAAGFDADGAVTVSRVLRATR